MLEELATIVANFARRRKMFRYRSSITGRMVSKAYAEAHPDETVKERVN